MKRRQQRTRRLRSVSQLRRQPPRTLQHLEHARRLTPRRQQAIRVRDELLHDAPHAPVPTHPPWRAPDGILHRRHRRHARRRSQAPSLELEHLGSSGDVRLDPVRQRDRLITDGNTRRFHHRFYCNANVHGQHLTRSDNNSRQQLSPTLRTGDKRP